MKKLQRGQTEEICKGVIIMIDWLVSQLSTIFVLLILSAVVALIIVSLANDRKKGVSSCGGSCGACPMHDKCHAAAKRQTKKEA